MKSPLCKFCKRECQETVSEPKQQPDFAAFNKLVGADSDHGSEVWRLRRMLEQQEGYLQAAVEDVQRELQGDAPSDDYIQRRINRPLEAAVQALEGIGVNIAVRCSTAQTARW